MEATGDSEPLSDIPTSLIPSYLSMKSDVSMDNRHNFTKESEESSVNFDESRLAAVSAASMKSDVSMDNRHNFAKESEERDQWNRSKPTDRDGHQIFQLVELHGINILRSELKRYERMLFPHLNRAPSSVIKYQNEECLSAADRLDGNASEGVLKLTLHVLKEMGQKELATELEKHVYGELEVCQQKLRHKLKRFEYIYEGVAQHGNQTLLNKIYTELYITEGVSATVNTEHEVMQIEAATRRRATEDKPIKCEDIFKPVLGQSAFIRTVLTKGISGIGKTISVQKFNVDWAEGRVNQDIQLLLNVPFRELNLMRERYTLTQFFHHFLEEAKECGISNFAKYKLVLIFDGLDECRLPLDFQHNEPCCSASEAAPVDVLLTNLFKGNLLPSAHIWITSRPAAADRIPAQLVDRVTEIRGFSDPQKEEYFKKKISDPNMASRIIAHVKLTRSLHIMCHIPVFSWISVTVLQSILEKDADANIDEDGNKKEMPKTLTQMYTHFLVYNTLIKKQKYIAGQEEAARLAQVKLDEELILKLGKLSFEHLMKGNMIFYENELHEFNISVTEAAVYSGIFTQISDSNCGFHLGRVYSFVHLSIQEYFAAMYFFYTFICSSQDPQDPTAFQEMPSEGTHLIKGAVDEALQHRNGQLDLYLRFLLGLSQTSNRTVLKTVLPNMGSSSISTEQILEYIKEKIRDHPSTERCINLFHCLAELNDQSLLEEIQNHLSSGSLSKAKLSPSQWSALVFVLLTSKEELDEFDLRRFSRSEEGLQRLLPVIKETRVAVLKECHLTENCCEALGEVLKTSRVKELDLSGNDLRDTGVKLLCAGLASPTCQLEKLRLKFCGITEVGCDFLASALKSNPTHLKELDLSHNYPGAMELLFSVQKEMEHLTIRVHGNAECYLMSALKKYSCELTMDVSTAHSQLSFSEDHKTMTHMETAQPYPDNPQRFADWGQVLCKEGLTGRCYWEVEWTGEWTGIGVAYKGIRRKAKGNESVLGYNDQSWTLRYCHGKYTAWYNKSDEAISVPYFNSKRAAVFLDCSAGTLSFYAVSPNAMTHLHTFHVEFSEPLYPGFRLGFPNSSLTLCQPQ